MTQKLTYAHGILNAFQYLLRTYPDVFAFGQGLWSPWYVGSTMTGLEKEFGKERVIDSPVSELACTGAAVGAALCGKRPIVIHPRMDFMVLAADQIINQAAKWSHMLGGQASAPITVRAIINRGGEQGAQHSQALHAWFAHIPGLRVVMPATAKDARDLLIASVLCNDPVMYIDDRWLYEQEDDETPITELNLREEGPKVLASGSDVTIVGAGYSTLLAKQAAEKLQAQNISAEVIDLRVINPLDVSEIVKSVSKTRHLVVADGSWRLCGLAGEIIASVTENIDPGVLLEKPVRITLPDSAAPTSKVLEDIYYPKAEDIEKAVLKMFKEKKSAQAIG